MSGRIFISYRRTETSATAGRIYDRLRLRFGSDSVFMDVDSVRPGRDFAVAIRDAVGSCDVVLAVIGRDWLMTRDESGRRRLDDPDDFVVLEIKSGLDRDIPVIPVLVEGAAVPRRGDLPGPLAALARRQALRLDHDSFDVDFARLMRTLEDTMSAAAPHRPAPSADPPEWIRLPLQNDVGMATLRSIASSTPTTVQVTNQTDATVSLYWVDYAGGLRHVVDLRKGQTAGQNTYLTHPFVVTNAERRLGYFLPQTQPGYVVIDDLSDQG